MKLYILIYEDKQGNELKRKTEEAMHIKYIRQDAKFELANSMMNDLYKIKIRRA